MNEIDRERVLRNRPELLGFARRADHSYENRDELKEAEKAAEAAHEAGMQRRWRERNVEGKELVRLRIIADQPGVEIEKVRAVSRAEQAAQEAERQRDKEDREERSVCVRAADAAHAGERAADDLRRFFMEDQELFERGNPPRLKAEYKAAPTEPAAPLNSRPPVNRDAVARTNAARLQAHLKRESREAVDTGV